MPRSSVYSGPKFVLPSSPNKQNSKKAAESDFLPSSSTSVVNPDLPWDEKYTPKTESELAVRVQKLNEIKYYINSSAISPNRGQYKMLVLTGPTGVGKSTAIRLVASSMGYDLIEWKNQQHHNPQSGHFDPDYEPTMEKFSRFLHRSINTATLTTDQQKPRIILLDDIPDLTTPYIKQKFQSLLKAYIESSCAFLIVLVYSVAQMATGLGRNRYSSWETQLTTLHDLVTPDIRLTGRCGTIEFNPIIKANLKKVLSHILACEARFSKRPSITQQQLEFIIESCHGDIRSAILTMQFYSINPYPNTKKRRRLGDTVDTSSISSRENPFDFFHAIGKVIYAKRLPSGHLESKPCNILGNTHIDTDNYLGFIYSNHAYMMDNIHDVANSMDYLCEADMLSGMGAWNDEVPVEYQLLISMFGVMAVERKPEVLSRKLELAKPGDAYYRPKIKETPRSTAPIVTGTPVALSSDIDQEIMEPIENDDGDPLDIIDRISDDEFDDIYGDGDDLASIDFIP